MSVPGIRPLNPPYPRKVADALTPAQVSSLAYGSPTDPCWTGDRERLLIAAADALYDDEATIGEDMWRALASVLDEEQRLDLLLSGWYHAVRFAASAARVQFEDHGSRVDEVIRDAR